MLGDVGVAGTGAELFDQAVEALGRLGPHEPVVDLYARGPIAVGQALRLFQGDGAVGGGAAGVDPEGGRGVVQELESPVEQTGDVGTHRHQVGAHRFGVQHVVEGGGAEHLGRGDADQGGDVGHGLGGEPTVLLLGHVAEGDEGRAGFGVQGDGLPGPLEEVAGQVGGPRRGRGGGPPAGLHGLRGLRPAHRSTSPITGSMVEQTATASASRPPRIMTGRAWRLTKLGPRMCIR